MRLLVVEDNDLQRAALKSGLSASGYVVDACQEGEDGLWHALAHDYDMIICDIMVPRVNGLEILRRVRAADRRMPVLLLTARDAVEDRVEGLDLGADDYLTKPFAFAELLARVRAMVRRHHQNPRPVQTVGDLTLDSIGRTVKRAGHDVLLTQREFAVLEYLMLRVGSVVSRTEMLEHLYESTLDPDSNALDVFVSRLRRKLSVDGKPIPIQTRRGHGYILSEQRSGDL